MSKILFLFLLFIGVNCAFAQINMVGEMQNGQPVLTVSASSLISNFSCHLHHYSDIQADFTQVEIISDESGGYLLHFFGGNYSSFIRLTVDNNGKMIAGLTSCTTTECASERYGCTPDIYGACRLCSNGGKCTKTVTSASLIEKCNY